MTSAIGKILYIDPLWQPGHVNFNSIFIESIENAGFELEFIFTEGYANELKINNSKIVYTIPKFLSRNKFGKIGNRIAYFLSLVIIRLKVNFKKYDFVIFSSFEEISFYFAAIKNTYLINHINVSNASSSSTKFFFLKRVLSKNMLIVLDSTTEEYLRAKGNCKVIVKPHGLAKAKVYPKSEKVAIEIISTISKFKHIVFSPSDGSSDKSFLNRLITNDEFLKFIDENDILFVFKSAINTDNRNVLQIDQFLDTDTYDYLFLKSDIILIAYPKDFQFRVSGVLLESLGNNKPCIISKIKSMEDYANYFVYDPYYSDASTLILKIKNLLASENNSKFYKNLALLQPDFNDLKKNNCK